MKIIYCLEGTFNSGGKERIIIAKANWLSQHGHDVTILTTDQKDRPDFYPLDKVKRIDTDIMYSQTLTFNPLKKFIVTRHKNKIYKRKLKSIVEEIKPDIIVSAVGHELILLPKIKGKSKILVEIHFSRWFRLQRDRNGIWKFIDKYLTQRDYHYIRKYDKFVCLTEQDKLNWNGIKNIHVINNFIEKKNIIPSSLKNKQLIAIGRLSYQKGFDRLILAWRKVKEYHPEWKLELYGNGALKNYLNKLIEDNNLQDVITIHEPTQKIDSKYLESSGLVMSSHYEGMPMVLLEAMSFGLPLISFNCQCGPSDLITDGYNGFLVKEGDINGLSDAIIKLIENETLRQKMGENSFNRANQFLKDDIMAKWQNLLNSLIMN